MLLNILIDNLRNLAIKIAATETKSAVENIKKKEKCGLLVSSLNNYFIDFVKRPHFSFFLIPSSK